MIYYYLIIPQTHSIASDTGAMCGAAINTHSNLGNKIPNLLNEVLCCAVITDVAALRRIPFTDKDDIRLSLRSDQSGYHPVKPSHFDINNIDRTHAIYNYLKEGGFKVNNIVAYI